VTLPLVTLLLVAIGGAMGALGRFLVDRAIAVRVDAVLPWGTLAANVAGSALLGALAGAGTALPDPLWHLAGVGFCGALTTWSTFGYETIRLASAGARAYAVLNVVLTLSAGLTAASLGWLLLA
jgi:CrcB protein